MLVQRPNYKLAKWAEIGNDVKDFAFEPADQVATMTNAFVAMLNNTEGRNIPLCKPRSTKHRLPWMRGAGIKKQRTRK